MKKTLQFLLLVSLVVIIIAEIVGRYYGLTSFPLYVVDPDFEYIASPNQDVYIYGNHFVTNQYSQRSEQLVKSDTLVCLLIGDSVIFGGNTVDQDSLASTILEHKLKAKIGQSVRVLNISSKSWGPDNAAAYVRKYGTFSADKIILVFSSHDAHDNMTFEPVVGVRDSYPTHNASLALTKIIDKWYSIVLSKINKPRAKIDTSSLTQHGPFNPGFDSFRSLTDSLRIPLIVYLHKTTDEIRQGKLELGGEEIKRYCKRYQIPLIEGNETKNLYEDHVHFNERGQQFLSNELYPFLLDLDKKL